MEKTTFLELIKTNTGDEPGGFTSDFAGNMEIIDNFASGVANNYGKLSNANSWTKAQVVSSVQLTDDENIETDALLSNVFYVTLEDNRTLANPTNLVDGGTYVWFITQDNIGNRTLSFGNIFAWPSKTAPTLSPEANAVDIINGIYRNGLLYCIITNY